MTTPPLKHSPALTALASWFRIRRFPRSPEHRIRLFRLLARLFTGRSLQLAKGPVTLSLDPRDFWQSVMALGLYEEEIEEFYARVLRPGDVYIDIGAQLGFTAGLAAAQIGPDGRMVLFEPDHRALERLRPALRAAPASRMPQTDLIEKACSDRTGQIEFNLSSTIGQSSITRITNVARNERPATIRTVSLDEELNRLGIRQIRLLKIDVEGHEPQVLKGFQEYLAQQKADFLILEKNEPLLLRNGYTGFNLHALIAHHGYTGMEMESGRPITQESLARPEWLDNVVYARDWDMLRAAFPGLLPQHEPHSFLKEELAWYRDVVMEKNHPGHEANLILLEAVAGDMEKAVEQGEELLDRHPTLHVFRGHVANWLLTLGEKERSMRHLEKMISDHPNDTGAKSLLRRIKSTE